MFNLCSHKWRRWSKAIQTFTGSQIQVRECEVCGAITKRMAISIMAAQVQSKQVNDAIEDARVESIEVAV